MPSREDQFVVTVTATKRTINGTETRNLGVMDTFEGGETSADDSRHKRGGMQGSVPLGGTKEVGNITTSRLYDGFMQEQEPWLENGVGALEATITKQPLDDAGLAFGRPRVFTAKLVTLTPPDHDADSSDGAMIELEFAPYATIG